MPRGDDSFQIKEKINHNTYKVDLPGKYVVSVTFNVVDLSLFDIGDDSRLNTFEKRGNDVIQALKDTWAKIHGSITRFRAKKFKEAFN